MKIPNIPFSGKLPCNSILQSSLYPEYAREYRIMSHLNIYSYRFSINQWWLKWNNRILYNLYLTLVKDFLSHLEMRIYKMSSSLTRSDRFFIDQLKTSIHTKSYLEHPVYVLMPCLGMNQNMSSCTQDSMMISGLRITCTTPT